MIIATYCDLQPGRARSGGRLSDRIGRKPVLMLCTSGAAVAYLLLAFAETLWMIYAARALVAGLMAGNFPVASAMMADVTPPGARRRHGHHRCGLRYRSGARSRPRGPARRPRWQFRACPACSRRLHVVLAVLAAWLFLPESHGPSAAQGPVRISLWSGAARQPEPAADAAVLPAHGQRVSAITYLFPLWVYALLDWQAREVGIVFGVVGVIMALNQGLLMGRLVSVFGELKLLRICISLFLAGPRPGAVRLRPVSMVGSLVFALTGATLCMPILNAMTSRRGSSDERGRLLGALASAAAGVGRITGPLLAGALLTFGGFRAAWTLPLLMVALYWLWAFSHWATREPPVQPAD
jgi:DHA1 family tetracycline resistance protein-like MFS transporter